MSYTILGICGSLRAQSSNKQLLLEAGKVLAPEHHFEWADLSDIPFYNPDISEKPAAVERLLAQFANADGFVFGCTEYNYSIAPALKNALDWASRAPNNALLAGKAVALMGAGGGMGTSRAQYHLRQVGVYLDLHFVNKPEIFVNAFGPSFSDGQLVDDKFKQLISQQMQALIELIRTCKK